MRTISFLLLALCACQRTLSQDHRTGQTTFLSAPPGQNGGAGRVSNGDSGGAPAAAGSPGAVSTRAVEETDIYRLEGNRLYTLNGYRGLLVFDVSDIDHPKLLGRSPIYGWPIEMVVHQGIATVVVSDWYGQKTDGTPFHGSVVRGLDATDPSNIRKLGEAQLAGWVEDTRVVGEVLYAVSQDYGWTMVAGSSSYTTSVVISSVNFAGGLVEKMGERSYSGWNGVINVTPNAILLAHDSLQGTQTATTQLTYIDISDPAGAIAERGSLTVPGRLQGWGPDNGRWNLDFADGKTAHVFGCSQQWCGGNSGAPWVLSTVSFANPGLPVQLSSVPFQLSGWSPAVRFDSQRMYLSPGYSWTSAASTPLQVYDLTDPYHPHLAGETQVPGAVWSFFPQGMSVMALGSDFGHSSERVSVNAIDTTDPAQPRLAGTVEFGDGWAWTPAAGTFKAFTRNDALGLIVLPFSGWSQHTFAYRNGLQLIESAAGAIHPAGAAITRGWVERGIFANGRLLALSNLSLSVIDYTDHQNPKVVTELVVARNTTSALPMGDRIAETSSDFWDNDLSTSSVRVLPIASADEITAVTPLAELTIDGVNARVFRNGDLAYLVSDVRFEVPCPGAPAVVADPDGKCRQWSQEVQVVDLSSGGARVRGKALLPAFVGWGLPGPGFFGCFPWDWFNGADAVQVQGNALAFRRWLSPWLRAGPGGPDRLQQALFIVDLANPDAPAVSQLALTDDDSAWWGNLVVVGDALYATHEEWVDRAPALYPTVRYWANRIDLADRAHPRVASRVNVPGVVIGGPASDPSLLYVTGYRWGGTQEINSFDVLRLHGDSAELLGSVDIDGWVGRTFVRGTTAYASAERWDQGNSSTVTLHQLDLGNPAHPVDRAADAHAGWGWLVGIEGDRAVVTSGWGGAGLDVYKLSAGAPPRLDRFVRTRGWWTSALSRQGDDLFVSSGYWGVETIHLGAAP